MTPRSVALAGLIVLTAMAGSSIVPIALAAHDAGNEPKRPTADSPARTPTATPSSRAPSGPPLNPGASGVPDEEEGLSPAGEADPLVSNGLGSPTCKRALGGELSAVSRQHCETSGFIAAAAPTGNYGIDVHIDTGVLGLSSGGLLSTVQDLFVTPLWMALVWSVHALVVMLEWSFTIDLLDSATASGLGSSLRTAQEALTRPWLPMALAVASLLVVYDGVIRRRVAETLGEALMMGAMMAGGLWLIFDPSGTVGVLGRWASQASVGTLAVAARGTPATPGQALSQGMNALFAQAIEAPWCYLEFGEVDWCKDPAQLDPRLHVAGLKIATGEASSSGCKPASTVCTAGDVSSSKALQRSAQLLRSARSNGAIFLALPANGSARNSINEQSSLLRTLCQTSEATNCRGPTAAQAEFRTNGGTWSRFGGLLLIAAGLLGMLLLLGFIAVRLLGAALFSVFYLLLAPAMVIVPAFGQSGRAVFRRWISRLLGAVVSKLLFSFLLGVVLAVLAILSDLRSLGWWTQWLLMSAFWWSAYARRHQVLGVLDNALAGHRSAGDHMVRRSVVRRVSDVLESRKGMSAARWAAGRRSRPAPDTERRRPPDRLGRQRSATGRATATAATSSADDQVRHALEVEHRAASSRVSGEPQSARRRSAKQAQLERLRRERAGAAGVGHTRRAAEMGHRADRVAGEIDRERDALGKARRVLRDGEHALRRTGNVYTRERVADHARFLDAQARLPPRAREHAALAGLAGYGREEYERLDPRRARAARVEIDRELALRRELTDRSRGATQPDVAARSARIGKRDADRAPGVSRPPGRGGEAAAAGIPRRRGESSGRPQAGHGRDSMSDRSSVLRDAREVAARRKRQLGRDRP